MANASDVAIIQNGSFKPERLKVSKDKEQKDSKAKAQDKMSEIDEHIAKRFDIKKRLGKGAYGIVWKAVDKKTKEVVAIKKIFDAFRNQTDAQRTFREIIFLQSFRNHPNIVKLHSIHRAANNRDIYLGFEYMNTDLHNVIKRGNILKDIHKRFIMYQMLKATKYIHSGNVIHRDQKPSNVLIDNACRVKIADFGLARSVSSCNGGAGEGGADPCLTDYVATRWYRAPEILIASRNYTKGIDMWSLGCILGEMLVGEPLFPGSSTVNQVERIMACIPIPTEEDIQAVCTGYGSSLVRSAVSRRTPLKEVLLRNGGREAVDLACRLLLFNPGRRPTAQQALQHPYVARFHQEKNEPILAHDVIPPLCDDRRLSVDEYRNRLYGLMKTGSSRNGESSSDSTSTTLERNKVMSGQSIRPQRPQAVSSAALSRPKASAESNGRPNLNSLLVHYSHKQISQNVQSEPKIYPNMDTRSKIQLKTSNFFDQKRNEKFNQNSTLNRSSKEDKRNPLRKNASMDDYITYVKNDCTMSNGRIKCKGDFVRSMSDETCSKTRSKPSAKKSESINNIYTHNIETLDRSTLNKFSQNHGVITASALLELRSSIR